VVVLHARTLGLSGQIVVQNLRSRGGRFRGDHGSCPLPERVSSLDLCGRGPTIVLFHQFSGRLRDPLSFLRIPQSLTTLCAKPCGSSLNKMFPSARLATLCTDPRGNDGFAHGHRLVDLIRVPPQSAGHDIDAGLLHERRISSTCPSHGPPVVLRQQLQLRRSFRPLPESYLWNLYLDESKIAFTK